MNRILLGIFQPVRPGHSGGQRDFSLNPALSGAIVGLLISLPQAMAMRLYAGILGTRLVLGALTGLAVRLWVT